MIQSVKISKKEIVYLPDGTVKEERACKETIANIIADFPIRPAGKLTPKKDVYNKMSVQELKKLAITKGLCSDASKLKKNDLLKLLETNLD